MLVNLSKNSWHAKYYKWVKGIYPTYEFKSLCPYFWTLVFYLLCSPLILTWKFLVTACTHLIVTPIVTANHKLSSYRSKNSKKPPSKLSLWWNKSCNLLKSKFVMWWDKYSDNIIKWFGRVWIGLCIIFFLVMLGVCIYNLFIKSGAMLAFIFILAFIGSVTIFLLVVWSLLVFFDSDTWNMVKGMGFSIKNKVCPMIVWDKEKE